MKKRAYFCSRVVCVGCRGRTGHRGRVRASPYGVQDCDPARCPSLFGCTPRGRWARPYTSYLGCWLLYHGVQGDGCLHMGDLGTEVGSRVLTLPGFSGPTHFTRATRVLGTPPVTGLVHVHWGPGSPPRVLGTPPMSPPQQGFWPEDLGMCRDKVAWGSHA